MLTEEFWQLSESLRMNNKVRYMKRLLLCLLSLGLFLGCAKDARITFEVQNSIDQNRSFETVSIHKTALGFLPTQRLDDYGIVDLSTKDTLIVQHIDSNGDGLTDEILFQPEIYGMTSKSFELVKTGVEYFNNEEVICYSRFVPERTDDYAWENDKVAFRVFGPNAQMRIEKGLPDGTLTSGVDAWLKKVDYPIINKWYDEHLEGKGSYHQDTGEGLDNFHVGSSRGVGGIGVRVNDSLYTSKNFIEWETLTNGPIRTSFRLKYADWNAGGLVISEEKIMSLDRGSNLTRFDLEISGTESVSVGLTLHEKDGVVKGVVEKGWLSYWQPHGKSALGTAIVVDPKAIIGFEEYIVEQRDHSHAFAHLKLKDKVTYYAGFGWKESGQFKNKEAWYAYLDVVSSRLNSPLKVVYH